MSKLLLHNILPRIYRPSNFCGLPAAVKSRNIKTGNHLRVPWRKNSNSAKKWTPQIISTEQDLIKVKLSCLEDQPVSFFHHVWLRDNCACSSCVHPSTRQKLHSSGDVPLDIQPASVKWVCSPEHPEKWLLQVEWLPHSLDRSTAPNFQKDKSHLSHYPISFLKQWDYTNPHNIETPLQPKAIPWSSSDTDGPNGHLHVDYRDLPPLAELLGASVDLKAADSSDANKTIACLTRNIPLPAAKSLSRAILNAVATHGLVFFHNVPTKQGNDYVETLAKRFGHSLRDTFYGTSWDVKNIANSTNVAYTSLDLGFHMDLMYFVALPGLQFLHMLQSSMQGGESLFIDMWQAWRDFTTCHPRELVDALTTTPVSYHYEHSHNQKDPHHLHFRHVMVHPSLTSNTVSSSVLPAHPSDDNVGSGLFYAPSFQAPLEAPPLLVKTWYQAIRAWGAHLRSQPVVRIGLKPGDVAVFHNRRVLHGRTAFGTLNGSTSRHLRGTYVSWDEFKDRWRVANAQVMSGGRRLQ